MSLFLLLSQAAIFICSDVKSFVKPECEVWAYRCLITQIAQDRTVDFATEVCMENVPNDFYE
jgi:hypothetical protein